MKNLDYQAILITMLITTLKAKIKYSNNKKIDNKIFDLETMNQMNTMINILCIISNLIIKYKI